MIPTPVTKGWRAETKKTNELLLLKSKEKRRKKRVLFSCSSVGKTTKIGKTKKGKKKPGMIEILLLADE